MQKKILFIKASADHSEFETVSPPLGLISLAAVVAERAQWQSQVIDTYLVEDWQQAINEAFNHFEPDVIGISALTAESASMHRIAAFCKSINSTTLVIAGGPHPTAYPDETLECGNVDIAVINEGEETLAELLQHIEKEQPWQNVAGIAFRTDKEIEFSPQRAFNFDLDRMPHPAWHLLDIEGYYKKTAMTPVYRRRYMSMMTSRGCPYRCNYCHTIQGKRFRAHSPEYIVGMVERLIKEHGIRNFEFFDDIFNWDGERLEAIMHLIINKGLDINFTFPNGLRGDRLSEEQIDLLHKAGCDFTALAIESAVPRLQKYMKKHLDLTKIEKTIAAFAKRRIFTVGFFMVGFPTETEEEMQQTINFATRSKLHVAYFFTVTPFQGTKIHEIALNERLLESEARVYDNTYVLQKINLSEMPDKKFFRKKKWANLLFYLQPPRMYRILRDFKDKRLFLIRVLGFIRQTLLDKPGAYFKPLGLFREKLRRVLLKQPVARSDANQAYRSQHASSSVN